MNPNETIEKYYKLEIDLISASGGDHDAIEWSYKEFRHRQRQFLESIQEKTLEFIGREQALKEVVGALNK